jgi:hypothetical protein
MSGAGAAGAAAAAAAKAAKLREEEEELTPYNSNDLDVWEFKIVRANSRKFKSAESVRRLCEEESHAGWDMVEKFDDCRIRFKRRLELRSQDQHMGPGAVDPYRTQIGPSETHIVLLILAVCAVGIGVAVLFGILR